MNPSAEHYARIQELFQAAIDLPPGERAAFLQERCGNDEALRCEVESLLKADADCDSFGEDLALEVPPDFFSDELEQQFVGQHFGPYEVVREIGRGGLGTVYLAFRHDGEYRKEVAIKLIRRGLDTDDILRRFRTERQILAQLDHPNIARLIDGGTTDDGLPYFAMEYINGEPITTYCDTRRLGSGQRLDLFRKVCAAVTYAHQNLVVHRDLKPSNILVTAEGEPKLLDFGIAKLLTADGEMFTQTAPGLRAMTPDYASPEQIRGEKITTASDVYALGVLLYELLTGQRPYRLKTRTPQEIAQAIAEQEPERPSTAITRFLANSPQSAIRNPKSLLGDLDNIVLTAMRKEPERRYSSPQNLAEDIRCHQEGLPVSARSNTLAYRSGKFIRRHKAGVVAATLIVLALVGGIIATQRQSQIAQFERGKAERRFNDVRKLANANLFEVYPAVENLEGSLKAREIILKNALQYLDGLAKEAGGDLELQAELATAYEKVGDVQGALNNSNLGKTKAGLETYTKASELRSAVLAARPNDLQARKKLANNQYTMARTLWMDSQTKEAEVVFEKALALQRQLVEAEPEAADLRDKLAVVLIDYGAIPAFNSQSKKALSLFDEALSIINNLQEKDPTNAAFKKTKARLLRILSKPRAALGDYAGGLKALEDALVLSKEVAQEFPGDFRAQRAVWLTETMICELFIDQGDGKLAVKAGLGTTDFPRKALQNEPENGVVAYDLAISHFDLARAYRLAGDFTQTISNADAAIKIMSQLSAKSPNDSDYKRNLAIYKTEMANAHIALNQSDAAIAALQEAVDTLHPIVEADSNSTTTLGDLGMAYRLSARAYHQKGESEKATELVEKAIAITKDLIKRNAVKDSEKDLLAELEKEKADYVD